MEHLIYDIPYPWDWSTAQTSNVIALISAIGTVGALWYAVRQGAENSANISSLAGIVKQLTDANELQATQNDLLTKQHSLQRERLKSEAKPDFQFPRTSTSLSAELGIYIDNNGQRAIIHNILYPDINDIEFVVYDKVIDKGKYLQFKGKSKTNKFLNDCEYSIFITYTDIYDNSYNTIITGKGGTITQFTTYDDDHFKGL